MQSQLVSNTFHNSRLFAWERPADGSASDLEMAYGTARAHNRGMAEFCSVVERLGNGLPATLSAS